MYILYGNQLEFHMHDDMLTCMDNDTLNCMCVSNNDCNILLWYLSIELCISLHIYSHKYYDRII